MPAVSEKQRRFMALCAGPKRGKARADCPLVRVAKEFLHAERKRGSKTARKGT